MNGYKTFFNIKYTDDFGQVHLIVVSTPEEVVFIQNRFTKVEVEKVCY